MIKDDAFKAKIYEDYYKKVYSYLLGQVNDSYLAEDLASDVFLKVYEKLDLYDETKASISTWIFTIARNKLTDYYRGRTVFGEIPETMADGSDIEEDMCNNEMLEILAGALEKLDERERDIIILHYYSGVTLKEIGQRLGISYAYVKILHNKALSSLKNFF